jgi:mRNA interferase MazF
MAHSFGDVVLVPFPFTDQSGAKKRPAVIVSGNDYNTSRRDLVIMAITSQVRQPLGVGEALLTDWQTAGLIKPSVLKPVFTTIEQGLVVRTWARFRLPICARCESSSARSSASQTNEGPHQRPFFFSSYRA